MENKRNNLKKKDISKNIYLKYGISASYAEKILDDTINILILNLKAGKSIKIKNFGSFKILKKKSRIGRNPKTKMTFEIKQRNSISFKTASLLKKKVNKNFND